MRITIEYRLYEIRIINKLTVRSLAKLSGVSKSTINNIEVNKGNPTLEVMIRLAEVLKVKPHDLYKYRIINN